MEQTSWPQLILALNKLLADSDRLGGPWHSWGGGGMLGCSGGGVRYEVISKAGARLTSKVSTRYLLFRASKDVH